MKIERMIGILSVLLQKEKITAPELAKMFEVSRRTINRDVEALCKAGIPISTSQGVGGGISIMEGYGMDKTILTSKDMQMILAGLRSLDSISGSSYYRQLMEKIKNGSSNFISGRDSILIDLSSWYKDALAPKIQLIQDAIEERKLLSFHYYAPKGESKRVIEPYYLVFKWSSWYVWGWCTAKEALRLFKCNRMEALRKTEACFEARKVPLPDLSTEKLFPFNIQVKAIFAKEEKWRLIEEYGSECLEERADGTLFFHAGYSDEESLVRWLLTFGDKVTVLEPEEVKERLVQTARQILGLYPGEETAKKEKKQ